MMIPMDTKPKELHILSWNANGISNKKIELEELIHDNNIDIFLLQETFLKPSHSFSIANYKIYRNDRLTGRQGGTLIGIKKNLIHQRTQNLQTQEIENTSIEISMDDGSTYTIISAYLSPLKNILTEDLDILFKNTNKTILGCDLNSKHNAWKCRITNTKGRQLHSHAERYNYNILTPDKPTHFSVNHRPDILDFFIIKNVNRMFHINTEDALSSDHNPVFLKTHNWINNIGFDESQSKINWRKYTQELEKINREIPTLDNTIDLENEVTKIEDEIKTSITLATTTKRGKYKYEAIPYELKELIKYKNRLQKRVRLLQYPPDKIFLSQLKNLIKKEIYNFKNEKWGEIIRSLDEGDENHKNLWIWKKRICGKKNREQPIHGPTGLLYTEKSKAECFSNMLQNQFAPNIDLDDNIDHEEWVEERALQIESTPFVPELREVTDEEVIGIISLSKNRKAPGEDGIRNKHLKMLPLNYIKYITNLFNKMLILGHFPNNWKNAIVVMIPKAGADSRFPQNFRPISLLGALSKIGEKIIRNRLIEEINDNKLIPDEQFGFIENHSTEGQALRLAECIYQNFEYKKHTPVVFMDVAKAFDKVWHDGLILKLAEFGIKQQFISLIATFIRNRTYQVRIGNEISEKKSIEAGVPQGAVLSPLLYDLFTADIPTNTPNTRVYTYADDTAVAAYSTHLNLSIKYLQTALDQIITWMKKWKIKINENKFQAVIFSRRKTDNREELIVNNKTITWKKTAKYLGIRFDMRLTWGCHITQTIDRIENRCNILSSFLHKKSKLNKENKLLLYKQVIRPIALYGSAVWGTTALSHLRRLDTCQNKILRKLANAEWFIRNTNIRQELNINTLQQEIHTRNKKVISALQTHVNPLLREALQYDPASSRRTSRPKRCLMD